MKKLSKILAVMLAVLMAATVLCVPIFAEEAQAEADPYAALKEGVGYVAFGDSFARGYGAIAEYGYKDYIYRNDHFGNWIDNGVRVATEGSFDWRVVPGSYPTRVAEYFGLKADPNIYDTESKMWPVAHDAVSTAYMLDFLGIDDNFRDEEFTYDAHDMIQRYETDLLYFGDADSLMPDGVTLYGEASEAALVALYEDVAGVKVPESEIKAIIEEARVKWADAEDSEKTNSGLKYMIANASLITIGLGQSDIVYKAQTLGLNPLMAGEVDALTGVKDILNRLDTYTKYWKDAYPLLLDYIKEVNPDCKVVLVGTINPLKDLTFDVTEDFALKIGPILDVVMDNINNYTKQCALKYGYMYVDIGDVETPISKAADSGDPMSFTEMTQLNSDDYALIAHPTPLGYQQIAEKIIEAVETDLAMDSVKDEFNFLTFLKTLFNIIKLFFANFFA